jgi:hypothetical protein
MNYFKSGRFNFLLDIRKVREKIRKSQERDREREGGSEIVWSLCLNSSGFAKETFESTKMLSTQKTTSI